MSLNLNCNFYLHIQIPVAPIWNVQVLNVIIPGCGNKIGFTIGIFGTVPIKTLFVVKKYEGSLGLSGNELPSNLQLVKENCPHNPDKFKA